LNTIVKRQQHLTTLIRMFQYTYFSRHEK